MVNATTHKHIQAKANTDKLCETKQNQRPTHLSRRTNTTLHPIRALPTPWVLSTAGKLLWYLRGPTSCLIVTLIFNVLFLWYFPLFICHLSLSIVNLLISVLCTQIERSLLSISIKTRPLTADWLSVFWDLVRHCAVKSVFKNGLVHV